jgi:hypothetical protein
MKRFILITGLFIFVPIMSIAQTKGTAPQQTKQQAIAQDTTTKKAVTAAPSGDMKSEQVEVKGKFTGKIEEKKIPLKLYFDPFDALTAYIQRGEYIYDKQLALNNELATTLYPIFASEQVIKPWLSGIVRKEIALFNPVYGSDVAKWEVFLRDERGGIFKTWSGEGQPPQNIFWDGRGIDGSMINPGITYYYSAEASDALGNVAKIIGRKLVLKGVLYNEMGEWVTTLRGDRVWAGENSTSITQDGFLLLREAADIIKEKYTKKLTVQVYSRNDVLSRTRAQIVMNYFLNNVIVPPYTVTHVQGFVDEVYNSSYIKIIL